MPGQRAQQARKQGRMLESAVGTVVAEVVSSITSHRSITGSTAVPPPNFTEQMICYNTNIINNSSTALQLNHKEQKLLLLDNPRSPERKWYYC